jgi:hypothetical protein
LTFRPQADSTRVSVQKRNTTTGHVVIKYWQNNNTQGCIMSLHALKSLSTVLSAALLLTLTSASTSTSAAQSSVELVVLGNAQDAGYPQLNCYKPHCMPGWQDVTKRRLATALGLIDHQAKQKFLFEATPDIKEQFYQLHLLAPDSQYKLSGIMLTHGHMGHYTGLMHLGREAAGGKAIPVYAMPRIEKYLSTNGPWSQLVKLNGKEGSK